MTGLHYIIKERAGFVLDGEPMRVFKVRRSDQTRNQNIDVWRDATRSFCGGCVGKVHAMSSTCYHARAVDRVILNERSLTKTSTSS